MLSLGFCPPLARSSAEVPGQNYNLVSLRVYILIYIRSSLMYGEDNGLDAEKISKMLSNVQAVDVVEREFGMD